jgi:hypothetical protein
MTENYINHVVLVLDRSISMRRHASKLIAVADAQIRHLAHMSEELDQETRVSVYVFGDDVQCLIYDKDVLRLPSIADLYHIKGSTALCSATLKSLDDLDQTATLYGDHAFLTYVLTDGQENRSSHTDRRNLPGRLSSLPDNWTVALLVPDQTAVFDAKRFGFPAGNIAVWDANDDGGIEEGFATIRRATDTFMNNRSSGIRGSRSIFSTGPEAVNTQTVRSNLTPLSKGAYYIVPVHQDSAIRDYIESRGLHYELGSTYYQLTKKEKIQPQKKVAIREKATGKVYSGEHARDLLGLPNSMHVEVRPNHNPDYDVFVQSTSVNRKLLANTEALVLL